MLVLGLSAVPTTSMGVDFGTNEVYGAPTPPIPAPTATGATGAGAPVVEEKEQPPVVEVKTKNEKRPTELNSASDG